MMRWPRASSRARATQFDIGWYPFTPANTPTSHWSFLYPAYLAAVYGIFGYHPLAARLIQAVVAGALTCWLAYRLGRRAGGPRVGLMAAAITALYGYFIYYNAALMTESFHIVLVLLALDLAMQIEDHAEAVAAGGRVGTARTWGAGRCWALCWAWPSCSARSRWSSYLSCICGWPGVTAAACARCSSAACSRPASSCC